MTVDTPTRVPAYCRTCGAHLEESSRTAEYDPFSGEPIKHSSLYCPNPSKTETSTLGVKKVTTTHHARWVNEDNNWVERY